MRAFVCDQRDRRENDLEAPCLKNTECMFKNIGEREKIIWSLWSIFYSEVPQNENNLLLIHCGLIWRVLGYIGIWVLDRTLHLMFQRQLHGGNILFQIETWQIKITFESF